MLADVDVATRVNVHMPWVDRTEATEGETAPGGAQIVLLRCSSVNPVTRISVAKVVAFRRGATSRMGCDVGGVWRARFARTLRAPFPALVGAHPVRERHAGHDLCDRALGALLQGRDPPFALALDLPSPMPRRAGGEKARRVAGRDAGQFVVRAGCPVDKPRSPPADLPGECPEGAASGWPFSWLLLFGHAKRSNPLAGRRAEARGRRARSRYNQSRAKEHQHEHIARQGWPLTQPSPPRGEGEETSAQAERSNTNP